MKKVLSLALAFGLLLVLVLAACSSPDSSSGTSSSTQASSGSATGSSDAGAEVDETLGGLTLPLTDTPTTLEWFVISDQVDLDQKLIFQAFKELTNVELKLTTVPAAAASEKINALVASKNLPDIICAGNMQQIANSIGPQGALAPVNEYLDVMPNFSSLIAQPEYDYYAKSYGASDGNFYILHAFQTNRDINHGMLYRKDIFDKHGIEPWSNPDEFYDALKQLKELYPNSTPFTNKNGANYFRDFSYSWGAMNGFDMYYNEDAGEWRLSSTEEDFKDMLEFTKKCYDEGLYDPEFLTLTVESWTTKMSQPEQAFVTWDWVDRMNILKAQAQEENPEYDLRYWFPVGPSGLTSRFAPFSAYSAVVAAGENAELSMKVLDFMYSEKGRQLMSLGIEGETYTINAETGMADYIGFDEGAVINIVDLESRYGLFNSSVYRTLDRRSIYFNFTEPVQEAQDMMVENDRIMPLDPILAFNAEDTVTIQELKPELIKKGEEFAFSYVLSGGDTDAMWEEWLRTAETYGKSTLEEIYNRTQKDMFG